MLKSEIFIIYFNIVHVSHTKIILISTEILYYFMCHVNDSLWLIKKYIYENKLGVKEGTFLHFETMKYLIFWTDIAYIIHI